MARGNNKKIHEFSTSHVDLSSRHFPDASDASMTFQIPFEAGFATRLLDEDRDFLQGLDDSFGTPRLPERKLQPPLTLEELTPRKKQGRHNLYDALSSNSNDESTPIKRQRFSPVRRNFSQEPENIRPHEFPVPLFGFKTGEPSMIPPSTLTQKQAGKVKAPPAAQGLVLPEVHATRLHPKKAAAAEEGDPAPQIGNPAAVPAQATLNGHSKSAERGPTLHWKPAKGKVPVPNKPSSTAANRLVQLGQMLTAEVPKEMPSLCDPPTVEAVSRPSSPLKSPVIPRSTSPFTLTQVSPRICHEYPGSNRPSAPPLSPMRPPTKRSVSPSFETKVPRAPVKLGSLGQEKSLSKRVKTSHPSSTKPRPRSSSDRAVKRVPGRLPSQSQKTARYPSAKRAKGALTSSTGTSGSSKVVRGRTQNIGKEQDQSGPIHRHRPGLVSVEKPQAGVARLPAQLTRPVEFRFQLDARLEARKQESRDRIATSGKRSEELPPLGIPDFKAMHATEAERANARKAHIAPTVPVPLEFSTEARLKEREKFEAGRRAREAELERQKAELRLQREREEEEEVRRMRKLAVPKAHEVPEWYAHAPKRSNTRSTSSNERA